MQFILILYYHKYFRPMVSISLSVFSLVPLLASVIQFFMYGISFINMSVVGTGVLLYFFALIDMNDTAVRANELEINYLVEEKKEMMRLFDQTATALVNAIDAKDTYTQGHSVRVAEYARKIAEHVGKSEEECEEIYYAGLLHDVGKIGVPGDIINKNGKLSNEEYEKIKTHAEKGGQILSSIIEYPYLSIGARHHHERFDGKGYPDKLKGDDIPEIARILAVADAYDAMTSKRSYRDPIPQQKVREEIIKGAGLQFDPKFANVMQHLIDLDTEYQMKEKETVKELAGKSDLVCKEY
ncbi:MAG: HD-GYP domain-containing protein, partial [Lachnospiraceae bacterium]|nr:HD-GYP domain-containing protein [Lachnospiraceae bacterium]